MQIMYDEIEIIRRKYESSFYEINICRISKDHDNLYTVICIKDVQASKEAVRFFSNLRKESDFKDFVTCISKNSYFYVFFKYKEESPMDFNNFYGRDVEIKAEAVKELLSSLIILKVPEIIINDLLTKENIVVNKENQKISFNYFLKGLNRYKEKNEKTYMKRLANVILGIFNEEIHNNVNAALNNIVENLNNLSYSNIMEVYEDFILHYDEITLSAHKKNKEKGIISKIKTNIKKVYEKYGLQIATIILAFAVVSMIIILTCEKEPENINKIQQIGTREIPE